MIPEQSEDTEVVNAVTAAMREADRVFEKVGGSTRHHVRDCLLPVLNRNGWRVVRGVDGGPSAQPETDMPATTHPEFSAGGESHGEATPPERSEGSRDYKALYFELLFEVARKHPGESRHETARRYIRERETPSNDPPKCASSPPSPVSPGCDRFTAAHAEPDPTHPEAKCARCSFGRKAHKDEATDTAAEGR